MSFCDVYSQDAFYDSPVVTDLAKGFLFIEVAL